MVTNFETITEELSDDEVKLIPILISGFKTHFKANPIKAPDIITAINARRNTYNLKTKFTEPRLRKCCNYIRSNGLIPLIATSNGYYVSFDKEEINSQITSLIERSNSILKSAEGLKKFIEPKI
jgi:hypothetical protein